MITKFNLYESINNGKPKKGDYVIVDFRGDIITKIGQITYIKYNSYLPYLIEYDDDFNYYDYGLYDKYISINLDEIKYWSKDKKELETLIQANKYNL